MPSVGPGHGVDGVVREKGIEPWSTRPGVAVGALPSARDEHVGPFARHQVLPAAPGAVVFAVAGPHELGAAPGGSVVVDEGAAPGEGGWAECCH